MKVINEKFISDLILSLESIQTNLPFVGQHVCGKELSVLNHCANELRASCSMLLNSFPYYLQELVLVLKEMIDEIDQEAQILEKEMHGVQNYSDYEYDRVKGFEFKRKLQKDITELLSRVEKILYK